MKRLMVRLLICLILLLACGAGSLLSGQCWIDAKVTKHTRRTDGNHMRAEVIAWAPAGTLNLWGAQAYGDFYYEPPSGPPLTLLGSGYSPSSSEYVNLADAFPMWTNTTTLDGRGDGTYWAGGWGNFVSSCGDRIDGLYADTWTYDFVVRPTVTVTGYPQYSNFAFWYLNGAPSIDGYYVQAPLTGTPNWSPPANQNLDMRWEVTAKPLKVSLSTSTGSQTLVTSENASDGPVYDVKIVFKIDGFRSEEFPLHINKPVLLNRTEGGTSYPFLSCPDRGWTLPMRYTGVDFWGYAMSKITTHEEFSNWAAGNTPIYAGWPYPTPAVWRPGHSDEWVSNYEFKDTMWAYDCNGTWNPLPEDPVGKNLSVRSANQKIYMGSGSVGKGTHVQTTIMTWFTDHGNVVP